MSRDHSKLCPCLLVHMVKPTPNIPLPPPPQHTMPSNYPPNLDTNIYLVADSWVSATLQPHTSLVLTVQSWGCKHVVTVSPSHHALNVSLTCISVVFCSNRHYKLNQTAVRGWISLIQSLRVTCTRISDEQCAVLWDIALVYYVFANQHPDLWPQDLWLLSRQLVKAVFKLVPSECHLRVIAQHAHAQFPVVSHG